MILGAHQTAAAGRPSQAIATEAGLSERAFRRLDDQVIEEMAGRQVPLVLDNCEHVAGAVAVVAKRLLLETRARHTGWSVIATGLARAECQGSGRPRFRFP